MHSKHNRPNGLSRRTVLKAAGVSLTASSIGLAGCLGDDDGDGDVEPVGGDNLAIWHAMGGNLGETLEAIGEDFESDADVELDVEFQDSYEDTLTNFLAALDSGEVPDLCQIDSLHAGQVVATEAYEPVENILPDDFPVDDFLPNVIDFFTIDDELGSLPFNNSNSIFYYNRDLFEEAGLDPDDPPATVDDVYEYSEILVDEEGVVNAGLTWPNHVWMPETWFSLDDQEFVDAGNGHDGDPETLLMDTDTGNQLYEWWVDMTEAGYYENPGIEAWDEATSMFFEEEVAMLITSTAFVASAQEDTDFEVDNAFYPSLNEERTGVVIGGASFFVPSGLPEDRYEDIGELLAHMASVDTQVDWHQGTGYYPIRQESVAELEDEGWFDENPMFRTAMDQLEESETTTTTKRMLVEPARGVQTAVQDHSEEVFGDIVDIETGIANMIEEAEGHLQG